MPDRRTLDYAAPPDPRRRGRGRGRGRQPYWVFLFAAWLASFPAVAALDQFLKRSLYGGSADGTGTILAMFAILPAVVIASALKRRWWVAAVLGGTCAPAAITLMYLLWR